MGLMSFIARKFTPEKSQPQIRAPPYTSKASSKSPVRLVQTKSPSDTPRSSSQTSSQHVMSSKAPLEQVRQIELDSKDYDEVPAPVVLGYREDTCSSNLSTRPTMSSRADSRLGVRITGYVPKSGPGRPATPATPTTPAALSSHRAQTSISSSRLTNSIRNFNTGKTYVDLLDAHSEFAPLDFQGRVKASGARDYGEDVADRNITANASKNRLQQEPADYAQRRPISSRANQKMLHSQTMQFTPATFEESHSTPTLADLHDILEKEKTIDEKKRRRSIQISVNDANRIVTSWGPASPGSRSDGGFRDQRPATSNGLRRGASTASKKASAFPSVFEGHNKLTKYAVNNQPVLSPQPTAFYLSASLATSALTASHKRSSTMHSMCSNSEQSHSGLSVLPDLSNLPNHLKERATTFKHDWHSDATDRDSAPSPCIRTNRPCRLSGDSMYLGETRALETGDHAPSLAGSARHWSMSSSTPTTTSSLSSAMYGRPQSRNTTCTSVDLNAMGLEMPSYMKAELSKGSPALQLTDPLNVDDYVSDDNDSFINSQLSRAANEEDLLFNNGYGMNGIQLPGLEDSFAASAPAPSISLRSSRRSRSVSRVAVTDDFETCLNFDNMASVNDIMLSRDILNDGHVGEDDDFLSPNFDSSRHRRSPSPVERSTLNKTPSFERLDQVQSLSVNRTHTPTRAHSPAGSTSSRRSGTKRLTAIFGPGSSPSSSSTSTSSGSVLGRNSLCFHPHLNHHHLLHGNNVGEQVIEEERLFDDKVDIATAARLRTESRTQTQSQKRASISSMSSAASVASVVSISKPTVGSGMAKTISIEGR